MNEDEAKTMRCCGPSGCGISLDSPDAFKQTTGARHYARFCIGSACMAWRLKNASNLTMADFDKLTPEERKDMRIKNEGYCGLAGKP